MHRLLLLCSQLLILNFKDYMGRRTSSIYNALIALILLLQV